MLRVVAVSLVCVRVVLRRLSELTAPNGVLIGDSVNDSGATDLRLRIRYRDAVTPWWEQRNVNATEIPELVEGTGWTVEPDHEDRDDHAVLLRRNAT